MNGTTFSKFTSFSAATAPRKNCSHQSTQNKKKEEDTMTAFSQKKIEIISFSSTFAYFRNLKKKIIFWFKIIRLMCVRIEQND